MLRETLYLAREFVAMCLWMATVSAVVIGIAALMGPLP